ncbi:D-alanyl-D-alanine carboxypeptidase [Streptomyces sp. NPDC007905]|uniref:D-alanyl-D-alanine carboxypeptidase n=1 Tax=Streptomyces sp. NPDC007905 TaxID=3364788 RepID=UPI0036E52B5B
MEEASVAGESPDRSKQHESSAEPTSGSAGTVPAARDPRLTVSREKDSSDGTVDTATKVLSVRDVKTAAASEDPEAPETAETPESKSPAKDEDADLREAVSAWVRSAGDTKKPEPEADATAKASEKSEEAENKAESEDAAEAEDAEDARSARGVKDAAEVEDVKDTETTADAEPEEPSEEKRETDVDAKADTESESDEDADADPKADTTESDEVEDAVADAEAKADARTDSTSEAEPNSETAAESDEAEGEDDAEDEDDTEAEDDAEDEDDDSKAAAADGDGEDAPQGPPADDESRTGGAGGNESDTEGEAEPAAETPKAPRAIDQPTTAFKAVRPKKPEVDQPTTMLKLGTKPKTPESEAERTSKFVALKSDVTSLVPQVGPERTTQQPLPPKPPLDLLAELTNTPPPPETPVRTLVRRVKIWTPLVLLLAIVFAVVQAFRPLPPPTLDLTAKDTYTFDGAKADIPWPGSGEAALDVQGIGTFGSSGTQKPVPIASVAKVMTAYVILRDHPLKSGEAGPKIKIDKAAEEQSDAGQESTVPVTAGDRISEREALEAILLPSANNVARLLARWDAGSEKAFVTRMNAAARNLGMVNTKYTDPSGLTNSTVSTAVDQVKLAKAAMLSPAFREVAAMMSYDDYKGANHSNYNRLVGHNNVVGIKTGTTTSALGNLVFAAKQQVGGETRTIIGAVMRQPAGGFDNTIISGVLDAGDKLIRAAQGALKSATILKKGDVVGYVDDGLGNRTPVVATKDVTAAGWAGLKVKLSFASDAVPHTAKAGTQVGTLTVGDGSAGAVKVPVALRKDLTEPGFTDKLTRLG